MAVGEEPEMADAVESQPAVGKRLRNSSATIAPLDIAVDGPDQMGNGSGVAIGIASEIA
jgi:hypothetical protein